jgi:hypothetical protein
MRVELQGDVFCWAIFTILLQLSKEKLQFNQFNGHVKLQTTLCHTVTKHTLRNSAVPNICPNFMDHNCK